MTDKEIVEYFLTCHAYDEGVTLDSNGQGPRRHLPMSQEIRAEFNKRIQVMHEECLADLRVEEASSSCTK